MVDPKLQDLIGLLNKTLGSAHAPIKQLHVMIKDLHTESGSIKADDVLSIGDLILKFIYEYPKEPMKDFMIRDIAERAFVMMLVATSKECGELFYNLYTSWIVIRYAKYTSNNELFKKGIARDTTAFKTIEECNDIAVQALHMMRKLYLPHIFQTVQERGDKINEATSTLQWLVDNCERWARHAIFPAKNVFLLFSSNPFFMMTYADTNVCEPMKNLTRLYQTLLHKWYGTTSLNIVMKQPRHGRMRIGLLSRSVGSHSIGRVTYGLVEELARTEKFDIFMYTSGSNDSIIGNRIRMASKIHELKVHLEEDVDMIRSHRLNALVVLDPMQDMYVYLLASHRMAPVQISTWGHPGTSGLETIDYYVTSKHFQEQQEHFTEKLVSFDSLSMCYRHVNELIRPCSFPGFDLIPYLTHNIGLSRARQIIELPQGVRIYGLVGPSFKLTPEFDNVLYEILQRDPDACLAMVKGAAKDSAEFQIMFDRLSKRLGPSCVSRVIVIPEPLQLLHFHAYIYGCTVILDTFPFGGLISTYDTFSVGRCMVAMQCKRLGKFTAGLYRAMDIDGLVAKDAQEYVAIAVKAATDNAWRAEKEDLIRKNVAKIHDDAAAVQEWVRFLESTIAPIHSSVMNHHD